MRRASTSGDIGLGTWALGGRAYGPLTTAESIAVIRAAVEAGTRFFDCADIYGDGRAEEVLGKSLPDGCAVATKVGYVSERGDTQDFDREHIERSLRESSARLRRVPDALMLHSPPRAVLEAGEALAVLDALRERGDVVRTGVSVRSVDDVDAALAWPGCSIIEVVLNLLDQRPADGGALTRARECGVAVVARVPLCFGYLSDLGPPERLVPGDHRLRWPPIQRERWARAARRFEFLRQPDRTLAQAAIAFCACLPSVAYVIPGARSGAQARENRAAGDQAKRLTPDELVRARALGPEMARDIVPLPRVRSGR